MSPYPYWSGLSLADRLRIAATEAQMARIDLRFVQAICQAADLLEDLSLTTAGQQAFTCLQQTRTNPRRGYPQQGPSHAQSPP
jgi:hypothetical protein